MTDGRAEDEDAPGAPQTGEAICPQCGGDGQLNGAPCPGCDGTGKITAIVGDA
jgi:DnaJ-class molecular chaperone